MRWSDIVPKSKSRDPRLCGCGHRFSEHSQVFMRCLGSVEVDSTTVDCTCGEV